MKNHGRFLYMLTGILALAMPGSLHAETMREALESALLSHPAVDVAKARQQATGEDEREQFSNYFPEVSATATGGRMFGDNSTTRGQVTKRGAAYSWLWEGSATLTQPIFNGFETVNRIDAARAREGSAEYNLADARQNVALRAGQAYLNVMRAQEALAKTRSYQDRIKDYLNRINKAVDSGAADEAEASQARNIQAMLENTIAEMEGQVKYALADYAEATGSMPRADLQDAGSQKSMMLGSVDESIAYATSYHPLVLSSKKDIEAEDNEISAERGVLLPDLDGEMSYLKRDQKEDIGGEVVDARAVMRASWNFSTGGAQLARIRKSKAERSEAIARSAQTMRGIERDIRRAYAEYETASKQDALNINRIKITRDLFGTYEKQFEASRVRLLQLMQAENQLFTTELERINSHYRMLMAELTTMASSGRLLTALGIEDGAGSVQTTAAVAPQNTWPETTMATKQDAVAKSDDASAVPSTIDAEQELSKPAGK